MTQASLDQDGAAEQRFEAYLDAITAVLGHADRTRPARAYCMGLLLPGERKSIEPMAARLAPGRVQAAHQSLHHLVAKADWSDQAVLDVVRAHVLPAIERHGPIQYWIVDDTGFPKKGKHSVGVSRQYCGQLGKQENCQLAVTLSVANTHASLPIAFRLYLPETWANDPQRRAKAGIPDEIAFQTKPAIALDQIRRALAQGIPSGIVLADAGYGVDTGFRASLTALGLVYVAGIQASTSLWPPGTGPLPPKSWAGRGRPPTRMRRDPEHQPVSAKDLAQKLPTDAWHTVTWREGSNTPLASRFAAVRVRPAHRDTDRAEPWPEEWLLAEWPAGEREPTKYFLSSLPVDVTLTDLVTAAKARWRIERDYQELKQEIGLGHYEGRGWRGFHHHASLAIAAYGFLVAERSRFPPEQRFAGWRQAPALPAGFRPRGAHPA
jgi:SRSO17 transposase